MSKIPKAAWPREYATRTMLSLPARIEGWKFQFESLAEVSDCSAEKRTAPGARVSYHNCLITGPVPLGVVLSLTHASQRVPSFPTEAVGKDGTLWLAWVRDKDRKSTRLNSSHG